MDSPTTFISHVENVRKAFQIVQNFYKEKLYEIHQTFPETPEEEIFEQLGLNEIYTDNKSLDSIFSTYFQDILNWLDILKERGQLIPGHDEITGLEYHAHSNVLQSLFRQSSDFISGRSRSIQSKELSDKLKYVAAALNSLSNVTQNNLTTAISDFYEWAKTHNQGEGNSGTATPNCSIFTTEYPFNVGVKNPNSSGGITPSRT